jgi:zinc protease
MAGLQAGTPAGQRIAVCTLGNGLRVIVQDRPAAKACTIHVTYFTGAAQDSPHECGAAHVIEHLMFRGSEHVGSGEHASWISLVGGVTQGSTGQYRSVLYDTVPCTELPLSLYLESDRMRGIRLDRHVVDDEKQVVVAEIAQKAGDRSAYWPILEHYVYSSREPPCPPVGIPADVAALSPDHLRERIHQYYSPNNALLTIVGNFNIKKVLAYVRQDFEGIPAGPPVYQAPVEHERKSSRTIVLTDIHKNRITMWFGLAMGSVLSRSWFSSVILGRWLTEGPDSPLYLSLVKERHQAMSVQFAAEYQRGTGVGALVVRGVPIGLSSAVIATVRMAIEKVATGTIPLLRLAQLKEEVWADQLRDAAGTEGRANMISLAVSFGLPIPSLEQTRNKIIGISAGDIQDAARKWLSNGIRTVQE